MKHGRCDDDHGGSRERSDVSGSDHTREYAPLLVFGKDARARREPRDSQLTSRHRADNRGKFWFETYGRQELFVANPIAIES